MNDEKYLPNTEALPRRRQYVKPVIEKINLVPTEAVLGSSCNTLSDINCYLDFIGGHPANELV
jgi:hypothetical protein